MPTKRTDIPHPGRHDRLLREMDHDPYKSKRKLREPTLCPECGAVYHKGHWEWTAAPSGAHEELCPACQRIRDHVPAGILTLAGDYFQQHKDEVMNLVHNVEQHEKSYHPLQRIMAEEVQDGETVITFTDAHLARGVGQALHDAHKGDLDFHYTEEDVLLRVHWRR